MEAADLLQPHVLGGRGPHGAHRGPARTGRAAEFHAAAERIHAEVIAQSWNATRKSFVGHYGGEDLDASLLQMVRLRFLPAGDPQADQHH